MILLGYPGTQGANDGFYTVDVPAGTYEHSVCRPQQPRERRSSTCPTFRSMPGRTTSSRAAGAFDCARRSGHLPARSPEFHSMIDKTASPSAGLFFCQEHVVMSKLLLICAALLSAHGPAPLAAQTNLTIPERLAADGQGRFTTLLAALNATGLNAMLRATRRHIRCLRQPTPPFRRCLISSARSRRLNCWRIRATLKRILLLSHPAGARFLSPVGSGAAVCDRCSTADRCRGRLGEWLSDGWRAQVSGSWI